MVSWWGYTVLEAEDGRQARQVWQEHPGRIDLLLSDMVMPGAFTGLDLAAHFRRERPGYSTDRPNHQFKLRQERHGAKPWPRDVPLLAELAVMVAGEGYKQDAPTERAAGT